MRVGRICYYRTSMTMIKIVLFGLILIPVSVFALDPNVSNVRFSQREGTNLVDIYYDLSDPEAGKEFNVSLSLSADGGKSFKIIPKVISGDCGDKISPGKNKHIIWDAGAEFDSLVGNVFVFKISATRVGAYTQPTPTKSGLTYLGKNSSGYEEYRHEKTGAILIKIPAGIFTMGSNDGDNDEKPVHDVYLDEYYIGKYEVTNAQYKKFCDATGRSYPVDPDFTGMPNYFTNYPDYPVVNVSWNDAKAYCDWADLRLPTEAEWEKAARGTDGRTYPWGSKEPDAGGFYRANYYIGEKGKSDGFQYTSPVGSYECGKSPYGCYDMTGNVWEWCSDWYDENYYIVSANNNPQGPVSGARRVFRGGSWLCKAYDLRCADRVCGDPTDEWHYDVGFRLACSP